MTAVTPRALRLLLASGVAAVVAVAAPAAAQDARLAAIADVDSRAAVGAAIAAAERNGLPREPLVTKALEGVEKGASGPRIVTAVKAMTARLYAARLALAPVASPTELNAAAGAIDAGIPADAIQGIRTVSPDRSITVALGVLTQLVVRGVPLQPAVRHVTTLVQRRASQPQLLALQQAVQEDLAAGVQPSTALDIRFKAAIAALPLPGPPGPAATLVPGGAKPASTP